MSENLNKKRIAKNSILLYIRMLFTMWFNLYATRLVLANLGVEDMGVYGVVGGIVGLFAVFSGGITNTVQRFLTFELGRKNGEPNKVFCSSLNIILIITFLVFFLLESIGLWFLYNKVNIPQESIRQAFWVYQFSVITCIFNLISIPYNALVLAHEKMNAYAVISIIQVIITCVAAWSLSLFGHHRLFIYSLLMTIISILIRLIYQIYCYVRFPESYYQLLIDRKCLEQMGKFAGVTTFSGIIETVYNQGVILVINWTFGVALNAVYTIALQLKNSVLSFAYNIFKAISPQIIKTYANGEYEAHKDLVYEGSKFEVYMIYFILVPFVFRTEYIMHLWLGNVPAYMVPFSRAIIIISLIYALFEPIRTSVLATDKIAKFMTLPNICYLLMLPIVYWLSSYFSNPLVLIVCVIVIEIIICVIRLVYAVKVSPINIYELLSNVVVPCVMVGMVDIIICGGISYMTSQSILGLIFLLLLNSLLLVLCIYSLGISSKERNVINKVIFKTLKINK